MKQKKDKALNRPFADIKKKLKEIEKKRQEKINVKSKSLSENNASNSHADDPLNNEKKFTKKSMNDFSPDFAMKKKCAGRNEDNSSDDAELFKKWVGDVMPLPEPERRRIVRTPKAEIAEETYPTDDAEVLATLSDLVAGEGDFDISDTDEYVEGIAPGVDRRLLKRLRRGDFSVQAHLDLHGMVREEAKKEVEAFIRSSRFAARRCVIIVHGRGLRSPGNEPVLKKALIKWLSRGRLGAQVLAFASTLAYDGGSGAMYVLLRR